MGGDQHQAAILQSFNFGSWETSDSIVFSAVNVGVVTCTVYSSNSVIYTQRIYNVNNKTQTKDVTLQ